MKKLILMFVLMVNTLCVVAQSPLTGIAFYKAYLDVPIVKTASMANGLLNEEMMDYICKKSNPVDVKYAIVNALAVNGKAAKKQLANTQVYIKYLTDNYEFDNQGQLYTVLGSNTAMCHEYFFQVMDTLGVSNKIQVDSALWRANLAQSDASRATEIILSLLKAQEVINTIERFDSDWHDEMQDTPVGLLAEKMEQDAFIQAKATKYVKNACFSNEYHYNGSMRKAAIDIIWNYMKVYDGEVAIIKISSGSFNPYEIKINGNVETILGGKKSYEFFCKPGYYHIEAVQQSGYVFSPTVNRRDVNVNDGETIEVHIGY